MRLELERSRHTAPVRVRRIQNVYQALVQAHADSIREKRPMDGGEGLHNLELVLKCHESARGRGQRVTLNS